MSNKSMTEPELKEFFTALKDSCGNSEKEQWYMGLIEDLEIAFTEDCAPDAGETVEGSNKNDTPVYSLIPFSEIDAEARRIAVAWVEQYGTMGFDIQNKHKLASDIMNYHRSKISEELLSNDTNLASKIASTRDKPFFVDTVRKLINSYLDEDISTSKLVEELNITAFKWCEQRGSKSEGLINEHELKAKFIEVINEEYGNLVLTPLMNKCVKITQQYTNGKLEEIEKWVDGYETVPVKTLIKKIKILKQQ